MDLVNILRIIDSRASLNNICGERSLTRIDSIFIQVLASSQCRSLRQAQVVNSLAQIPEWKARLLIHLQKWSNSALHQPPRPYGRHPVFPQHLCHIPPSAITTPEDPLLPVVNSQCRLELARTASVISLSGETKFVDRGDEILVYFNEDARASFDGF